MVQHCIAVVVIHILVPIVSLLGRYAGVIGYHEVTHTYIHTYITFFCLMCSLTG